MATSMTSSDQPPRPVAIVVLPFASEEQALTFANIVRGKDTGQTAIVTKGSCYEWSTVVDFTGKTPGQSGQVIEFEGSGWETFIDPLRPETTIVARETS